MNIADLPGVTDVAVARERIRDLVHLTPVLTGRSLDAETGAKLWFKCEHLQRTGSFKFRGASHAVSLLPGDCRGVATHSSGNHGAALACAAAARRITALVVMPENSVAAKVKAVRAYGGIVHFCRPDQAARESGLARMIQQGMEAVPPYDDNRIIAGQGSCALEILEQVDGLDIIVAPVGGGGLLAGTALAAAGRGQPVRVIGAEPAGANDTIRSLVAGKRVEEHHPDTIADGLRALIGVRNFAVISRYVEQVLPVSDETIVYAMKLIWSRLKQVVEPSGAVSLAAVISHPEVFRDKRVCVILSGGNLDLAPGSIP